MTRKANKSDAMRAHATRRLRERYRIKLNDRIIAEVQNAIENNRGRLVDKQSQRVSVYDVDVMIMPAEQIDYSVESKLCTLRCVWDSRRKALSSVLTTDMDPADWH
jgi:hypothetical protein